MTETVGFLRQSPFRFLVRLPRLISPQSFPCLSSTDTRLSTPREVTILSYPQFYQNHLYLLNLQQGSFLIVSCPIRQSHLSKCGKVGWTLGPTAEGCIPPGPPQRNRTSLHEEWCLKQTLPSGQQQKRCLWLPYHTIASHK